MTEPSRPIATDGDAAPRASWRSALDAHRGALDRIRGVCKAEGCMSWTSDAYQEDLLGFLAANPRAGHGVIEVGSYRGGFSALLAHLCREFGWPLYSLDVDPTAIESTRRVLGLLELDDHVTVFHGPLDRFSAEVRLSAPPALCILDGDHTYGAVVKDIQSVHALDAIPNAVAFHDYSLRHPTIDERVSDAVRDELGDDWSVTLIGEQMAEGGAYPTRGKPAPDGHFWLTPGSEGALATPVAAGRIAARARATRRLARPSWLQRVKARLVG